MGKDNFDEWADWYDQIYNDKIEEKEDLEFYKQVLDKRPDGKYLELACGTGRLYLEFLDMGYDVEGLDISQKMLDKIEEKASNDGLNTTLHRQDASSFELENSYDVIYYPFSAFIHHSGLEKQQSCMKCIYDHLKEDGIFALDIPVIDFEAVSNYGEIIRKEYNDGDKTYVHEFWSRLTNQTEQEYELTQRQIDLETNQIVFETTFELGLIPKNQMELLLLNAGFEEYEFYDGFNLSENIKSDSDRLTLVAYK